jgi:retron-type reverse transcriptase
MAYTALDRLRSTKNLSEVWKGYWQGKRRKSAPGVDGITPQQFNANLPRNLLLLRDGLGESYKYSVLRGWPVPKKDPSKYRLICIPTVADRVVQRAVLQFIEDRASKLGIANDVSFGFVKNTLSTKRGTQAARAAAIKQRQTKPWAFKADISAFFDRIQREQLVQDFQRSFSVKSLVPLVRGAVSCEVDNSDPFVRRVLAENGIKTGVGLRQGMPLSPILSNFLLRDFDRIFWKSGYSLVRYADDLVFFASSEEECVAIQGLVVRELKKLGLELSTDPGKTMICPPNVPVEFLGMELGLKEGTSLYCLTVSNGQMKKIKESFSQYHDVEYDISKKLDMSGLMRRIDQMAIGYRFAYGVADNFDDLTQRLEQWKQLCALKVYSNIFGAESVKKLSDRQKLFLMLR